MNKAEKFKERIKKLAEDYACRDRHISDDTIILSFDDETSINIYIEVKQNDE